MPSQAQADFSRAAALTQNARERSLLVDRSEALGRDHPAAPGRTDRTSRPKGSSG